MSNPRVTSDRTSITGFALGVSLGLVLGVATSLVFVLIVVGPLLGSGLGLAALTSDRDDRPQAHAGGGLLIGTGGVYLFGAINTLNSCQGQDVCGGASALPLLGFAFAVLAIGLVIEGITFVRHP